MNGRGDDQNERAPLTHPEFSASRRMLRPLSRRSAKRAKVFFTNYLGCGVHEPVEPKLNQL